MHRKQNNSAHLKNSLGEFNTSVSLKAIPKPLYCVIKRLYYQHVTNAGVLQLSALQQQR